MSTCAACGNEFTPARSDQRFCGSTCRQRGHRIIRDSPAAASAVDPSEVLGDGLAVTCPSNEAAEGIAGEETASAGSFCIMLNDRWRVIESDDRPPYRQWLLQRVSGTGGWKSLSFCQTRHGLLTAIHEKVVKGAVFYPRGGVSIPVDEDALDQVRTLPDRIAQG